MVHWFETFFLVARLKFSHHLKQQLDNVSSAPKPARPRAQTFHKKSAVVFIF